VATLSASVLLLLVAVAGSLTVAAVRTAHEHEAVSEARKLALQRLRQATEAITDGNARQAQEILKWDDPLLVSRPALAGVRTQLHDLRGQVALYTEFKKLLDSARYHGLFRARGKLDVAREDCRKLLQFCEEIEQHAGQASCGLPPLSAAQRQLFLENMFEAYLVAVRVEWDSLSILKKPTADGEAKAARQAIIWLNQAERLLPGCMTLYLQRAAFWERLGDNEAARADQKRAEALKPNSAVDRYWHGVANRSQADEAQKRGDVNHAQVHYKDAIADYVALLRIRPNHFWAYFDWATCQFKLGNFRDAIVGFTACIQIKPDVAWPYYNRGTAYQQLKEMVEAGEDFTAALERDPRYAEAYCNRGFVFRSQGQIDRALEDATRTLELNPGSANGHHLRAEIYRRQQRQQDAIRDYDRALELDPELMEAHLGRAFSCFGQGHYEQARADFTQVIRDRPKDALSYRGRAFANLHLRDLKGSLADWEQLTRLQPASPESYCYVARIRMGWRQYEQALRALDKAFKAKADYIEAYLTRAHLHHMEAKLPEALADLNHVLEKLRPKEAGVFAGVLNDRADIYRASGRLEAAAGDYRHSIQLKPKQADAYVGLALIYMRQGQTDQARDCYERMVAAWPESAQAYLRRAEFRCLRGQFTEALTDCEQAARLAPSSVIPALIRAGVEAARGDHRRAVAEAEQILQKAPVHDGHVLYAAACVWSLSARAAAGDSPYQAKEYVDRALTLLAQTLDKGFHDLNYQEHNRMIDDPALAPLQQQTRFRELLPCGL
jgi:tetratricopeptide (TPR) repeat protein